VEVGADRPPHAAALVAGLAVVPEAGDDASERLRAGIEPRPSRVVLEPRERPPLARHELAREEHVADHAPLAGDGLEREEAGAGEVVAAVAAVAAPKELVAAADGEERGAALDRLAQRVAARGEVRRDERLLAVLPAADVEEVVGARLERVADRDGVDDELVPA
jgi:hypothetical protein